MHYVSADMHVSYACGCMLTQKISGHAHSLRCIYLSSIVGVVSNLTLYIVLYIVGNNAHPHTTRTRLLLSVGQLVLDVAEVELELAPVVSTLPPKPCRPAWSVCVGMSVRACTCAGVYVQVRVCMALV